MHLGIALGIEHRVLSVLDELVGVHTQVDHDGKFGDVEQATELSQNVIGTLPVSSSIHEAKCDDSGTVLGSPQGVDQTRADVKRHELSQELNIVLVNALRTHVVAHLLLVEVKLLDLSVGRVKGWRLDSGRLALNHNRDNKGKTLLKSEPKYGGKEIAVACSVETHF